MTPDDMMFKPGLMKGQRILITGGGTIIAGPTWRVLPIPLGYEKMGSLPTRSGAGSVYPSAKTTQGRRQCTSGLEPRSRLPRSA